MTNLNVNGGSVGVVAVIGSIREPDQVDAIEHAEGDDGAVPVRG